MSADNPVKQLTQQDLDNLPLPQTRGELRQLVAEVFDSLLKIPENTSILGQAILGQVVRDLGEVNKLRQRQQARPVLTKVYYNGAVRCTVTEKPEGQVGDQLLAVVFEKKVDVADNATEAWETVSMPDAIIKLVLSASAVPGDVFFLTTNMAIEAAMEEATDLTLAAAAQAQAEQQAPEAGDEKGEADKPAVH